MSEKLRKRTIKLNLANTDLKEFVQFCYENGTTPAEVLEGFINDLIDGSRTRGSDERMLAGEYFSRCCYPNYADLVTFKEYCSFLQYVLCEQSISDIEVMIEDKECFENEIDYLKKHPEECEEGELEDVQHDLETVMECLQGVYNEYLAEEFTTPDTLDAGLYAVKEYIAMIHRIEKGGKV